MPKPYKVIVFSDVHLPFEDRKALASFERYMADNRWDEWLCLGDLMDFGCISRFDRDLPGRIAGQSLAKDFAAGNDLLDRHQKLVRARNPKAKFTFVGGNHCTRIDDYLDQFPQLRGTIDVPIGLRLEERKIRWIPPGDVYTIGKCRFTHGFYCGVNHARRTVDTFGGNVCYGHSHDVSNASKMLWGAGKALMSQSIGCLCRYDMDYMKGRPAAWQHAFAVFHFMPDGRFNHYVVRISRGQFVAPDGREYGG